MSFFDCHRGHNYYSVSKSSSSSSSKSYSGSSKSYSRPYRSSYSR